MSDPKRLLAHEDASALEREMLASWRAEGPSPDARAKTLGALGLSAGLAASSTAATASITPKAATSFAALAKWIGAAAVVGAVSTATIVVVHSRTTSEGPLAPPLTVTPTAPPITVKEPAPVVTATADEPVVAPTSRPVVTTTPSHASAHKPASAPDLLPQISLVDRARARVAAGDPAGALALVDRYRADFPGGQFEQEADLVEIEALEKKGDDVAAKAAARRFLAAYPSSPHDAQVRAAAGL
ncbi:MAG TPA: hypothetical protein VF407_13690 [Polyangiaceae bacterium]